MRALLVPVKSFRQAKHRLAGALDDATRAELARRLAATVLRARGTLPAFVACDDGEVADWAIAKGAFVLWTPGLGLSGAVAAGVAYLNTQGVTLAVVAHADLPLVTTLDSFGEEAAITLAPDYRRDGTNVAAVPTNVDFRFSYGPGSFGRHSKEAVRLELPLQIVSDDRLSHDVDLPSDLPLVTEMLEAIHDEQEGDLGDHD